MAKAKNRQSNSAANLGSEAKFWAAIKLSGASFTRSAPKVSLGSWFVPEAEA
jgi:hypothetical protein